MIIFERIIDMNRRSFFKTITGFAAGVVAAFAPSKAKAKMTLREWHKSTPMRFVIQDERDLFEEAPWDKLGCKSCFKDCGQWDDCKATLRRRKALVRGECGFYGKHSGSKFLCNMRCNCLQQQLQEHDGRMLVICPHIAPYWVNSDGTQEDFVPTELSVNIKKCLIAQTVIFGRFGMKNQIFILGKMESQ